MSAFVENVSYIFPNLECFEKRLSVFFLEYVFLQWANRALTGLEKPVFLCDMNFQNAQAPSLSERRKAEIYCFEATKRSGSNLWLVGRFLPERRRKLFTAAYASMREVDDFVDDVFLALPPAERAVKRSDTANKVEAWRALCEAALSPPTARIDVSAQIMGAAPIHPLAVAGLSDAWGGADIGAGPWNALAQAMQRDIAETPFVTWSDFDTYCEGATVAPASIFIYVLSASLEEEGPRNRLPAPVADCARSMAIFCYLVHIARDLGKDAAASPNLVTLPQEVLEPLGLNRESLGARLKLGETEAVIPLVSAISHRASEFRTQAIAWQDRLSDQLSFKEKTALNALMTVYKSLHSAIEKRPEIVLDRESAALKDLKRQALEQAGVPL